MLQKVTIVWVSSEFSFQSKAMSNVKHLRFLTCISLNSEFLCTLPRYFGGKADT